MATISGFSLKYNILNTQLNLKKAKKNQWLVSEGTSKYFVEVHKIVDGRL